MNKENNYQDLIDKEQEHPFCSPCSEEEYKNCKFKIDDKVKIIKYGSLAWVSNDLIAKLRKETPIIEEKPNITVIDITPSLVGKTATIDFISMTQGRYSFILKGVNKTAWYN